MQRREFITLIGGAAAAWPLAARAQKSKMARIGALYIGTADAESFKKELREGLRELGYVEGVRYRAGQYPVQPAKLMHLSFAGAINASLFGGVAL